MFFVLDLREGVGKETSNNLLSAVHHVPVIDDHCLFFSLVPHRAHDDKSGLANCLKDSKKCPDGNKSWKAEACSMAAKNNAPTHDVDAKKLCNGYALNGQVDWVFHS